MADIPQDQIPEPVNFKERADNLKSIDHSFKTGSV